MTGANVWVAAIIICDHVREGEGSVSLVVSCEDHVKEEVPFCGPQLSTVNHTFRRSRPGPAVGGERERREEGGRRREDNSQC
jgi:hypothetical protein